MKQNNYIMFTLFAIAAVLASSLATYDIAVHFSPSNVKILWSLIPPAVMGLLAIIVLDGIYLLLDFNLAKLKTPNARMVSVIFMVLLWCIMASTNIASAVINNTIDGAILGGWSWVVYGVKLGALIYLAWYTYIRVDDPETRAAMIAVDLKATLDSEMNSKEKLFGVKLYKVGADMIVLTKLLNKYSGDFEGATGMDVRVALGENWRRALAGQAGIPVDAGFIFPGEKRPDAGTPDADAGNPPPRRGKPAQASPAPLPVNAGTPDPDAGNAGTPEPDIEIPVRPEAPNLLQSAMTNLSALLGRGAKNPT